MTQLKNLIFGTSYLLLPIALLAQAVPPANTESKETEGKITETKLVPLTEPDSTWNLAFYGFVKADYIYASKAVLSYGREQMQAGNQAKRQVQRDDYQRRDNVQLHDTRLGFRSRYGNKLTGVIELDFKFFGGQKWDIFSPLNPDTYNIINSSFYNGNLGWMREQFGLAYQIVPELRTTLATGNSAVNIQPNPSVVERNSSPTVAGQLKWTPNKKIPFIFQV